MMLGLAPYSTSVNGQHGVFWKACWAAKGSRSNSLLLLLMMMMMALYPSSIVMCNR